MPHAESKYVACAVTDCHRPVKSRALCPRHARIARTYFETDTAYTVAWLRDHQACDSCGATDRLRVDHVHGHCATGCKQCVRGRLCHGCNVAEGYLQGSPERARALAEYLDNFQGHPLPAARERGSVEV